MLRGGPINFLDQILNLVFPPRCEVCRKSGEEALCPECFSNIKFMKPQFGIHCVSSYDGVLRTALHRFKFQKRKKLAEPLGVLMVNYLGQAQTLKLKEIDGIIPVPLHPRRRRERGYNQTELLAGVVGRYYEVPVLPSLERVKNTQPQFELKREARQTNIKGAFRVSEPKSVNDKRVLLLDDIYTTGSTISECVRVLNSAGARRIEVLTLSRAVVD
jgi:ComF family protein